MRTRLAVLLLVIAGAVALAAPPLPIVVTPGATEIQIPCSATGAPTDGGAIGGGYWGSLSVVRVTEASSFVCFGDGGTLATGCADGGTCFCSSGGRRFPQGAVLLMAPKSGAGTVNCRGDGGLLSLTPVDFIQ